MPATPPLAELIDDINALDALLMPAKTTYFVDPQKGDDTAHDGKSWDAPKATIQAAITASNAEIDWSATPKRFNRIYVAPGVYAENLTPPYYCQIVGTGIRGTDTETEIHPTSGSCFTGTFLGTHLFNLRMEVMAQDDEILDLGICNNSRIKSCVFALGANVSGVVGIDTENCTHLWVEDCDFESGQLQDMAYAIYHRGGADKFAHNCRYLRNRMWVQTCGIWIQDTCTASQSLAQKNFIKVAGTGKGIDDNNGNLYCVENDIVVVGAGDAIEHAGGAGFTLRNHTLVNGSYALETA